MIQANELRIGNWYSNGSGRHTLSTSDFMDFLNEAQVNDGNILNISPIPLTGEILEKCGFEKHVTKGSECIGPEGSSTMEHITWINRIGCNDWDQTFYFEIADLAAYFDYCRIYSEETPDSSCQIPRTPQYVHQLQNLWHCISQTELNINL